jgi:hypothetical protein
MNTETKINSQEILNALDLGKINLTDKKKRGRPKKSQQIINPISHKVKINNVMFEQDEIILHLPISSSDIQLSKNTKIFVDKQGNKAEDNCETETSLGTDAESGSDSGLETDTGTDTGTETDSETETSEHKIKTSNKKNNKLTEPSNKQYTIIIKKLKEENEKLKKYLIEITPMYFTEVKTYPSDMRIFTIEGNQYIPKKTDIPCWWCTYNIECLPVGMAEYYHNNTFYVRGCFCSFNCKAAYNLNINDNRVWERYSLMKLMYYQINKDKITSIADIIINPAGPKELLTKYGGSMTIEEYRKNSKILGKEYHTLIPPFFPINTGFEECTSGKTNSKTMNIHNLLNPNSKDNMVIKRNKPLKNVASKEIDTFIE